MANAATEPATQENWRIQDVKTWPGAFGIYKYSKQAIKLNILPLIILYVVYLGISMIPNIFTGFGPQNNVAVSIFTNIFSTVVSIFYSIALVLILLDSIRGVKSDWIDAIKRSAPYLVKYFLASILVGLIVFGSLLALIIPFFFIAPRMANVFYHLIDKNMGVIDSINASWNSTSGNVGKVYGIIGVYLLIALLFITILGIPFAIWFGIMYIASSAVYYEYTRSNIAEAAKSPEA